jgi:HEAT repeat protein
MNQRFAPLAVLFFCGSLSVGLASGLPKTSIQAIVKSLQDTNADVRTSAALVLIDVPDEMAVRPLETALIASAEPIEQDAMAKALIAADDNGTVKRLTDALGNPQFAWGAGAKAKAVVVIARIGQRKVVKWLTDLLGSDQEPAVRAAALHELGTIGAPPKKDEKKS